MSTMASQITSLTVVYSTVYSNADQRKHQSSASLAFVRGIHRDRWIPRTKGQLRGKCFHLMTSSWWSLWSSTSYEVSGGCRFNPLTAVCTVANIRSRRRFVRVPERNPPNKGHFTMRLILSPGCISHRIHEHDEDNGTGGQYWKYKLWQKDAFERHRCGQVLYSYALRSGNSDE